MYDYLNIMKDAGFRFLEHTADVRVHSWGKSLENAFEQTAYGLMTTITPNLEKISLEIEKEIKIEAEDKEALLFDFLSEFLFIFDVEELVFKEIKVQSINLVEKRYELSAILKGEVFNKDKHEIGTEVKAITYSFLEINEDKDKVEIKMVFDI